MGITSSKLTFTKEAVSCGECFTMKLTIQASPDPVPINIECILLVDCSASIGQFNLQIIKNSIRQFFDNQFSDKEDPFSMDRPQFAIVSFSDEASVETPLTSSAAALQKAAGQIKLGTRSNPVAALLEAERLFSSSNHITRLIILLTDGGAICGPEPQPFIQDMRNKGIRIVSINLEDCSHICAFRKAEAKTTRHNTAVQCQEALICRRMLQLVEASKGAGLTNGLLQIQLASQFRFAAAPNASVGTAYTCSSNSLHWDIDSLGADGPETAVLECSIQCFSAENSLKQPVLQWCYTDDQDSCLHLDNLLIRIDQGSHYYPLICQKLSSICIPACQHLSCIPELCANLECQGRVVEVNITIENVCPNREIALAIILYEKTPEGSEHQLAMKVMKLAPFDGNECRDIHVHGIPFVLPESCMCCSCSICQDRHIQIRTLANYLGTELECCHATASLS